MIRSRGLVWWGVALLLAISALTLLALDWVGEVAPLVTLIALPLLALVTLGFIVAFLMRRRRRAAAVLLIGVIGLAVSPLRAWGGALWFQTSLEQHQPTYLGIIAESEVLPVSGVRDGDQYWIERRTPALIYFERTGVLTSHGGFVYDATDTLKLEDPNSVMGGIGGYQSCIRLKSAWYRCWFS